MKRTVCLALVVSVLSSAACAPSQPPFAATPTGLEPTLTIAQTEQRDATNTVEPTATITAEPTFTAVPTATLAPPASVIFEIEDDVPAADLAEIREGIGIAHQYLVKVMGGDEAAGFPGFTVKIIADGQGNQEFGADGSCCTALSPNDNPRPFFDVLHLDWLFQPLPIDIDHRRTAVHEYVHGWQRANGCLSISATPMGNWLIEGMAEYMAWNAIADAGFVDYELWKYRAFEYADLGYAIYGDELLDLTTLEGREFHTEFPEAGTYFIAFIAADALISQSVSGPIGYRTLCDKIDEGATLAEAFEPAFGISKQAFYDAFPALYQAHARSPYQPICTSSELSQPEAQVSIQYVGPTRVRPRSPSGVWHEIAVEGLELVCTPRNEYEVSASGCRLINWEVWKSHSIIVEFPHPMSAIQCTVRLAYGPDGKQLETSFELQPPDN